MKLVLSMILSLLVSGMVLAEGGPACRDDVQRLCKDVKPGSGDVLKCLQDHQSELSEACKNRGQQLHDRMQQAREACKADFEKFCKEIKKNGGSLMKCFADHEADLSAGCKAARSGAGTKM